MVDQAIFRWNYLFYNIQGSSYNLDYTKKYLQIIINDIQYTR